MTNEPRLIRPNRSQPRWDLLDLESQLPPDHPARIIWAYVETLDLQALHDRVKARGEHPGRPASDPAVLLAVWLHAVTGGVGSARAVARLCEHHSAYRWLCGDVPVNHDMLSAFRRDNADWLDGLLTRGLASLIEEGLISLDEVAIDGTRARARAGRNSLAGRRRFERIAAEVGARVARLKSELDRDPGGAERLQRQRALRLAEQRAARIRRAGERLKQYEAEQAARVKRDRRAAKTQPLVSLSDPGARRMRMADGSVHLAWNVAVATAAGFMVAIEPTERRNDTGLAAGLIGRIKARFGVAPKRLLADARAMTVAEIAAFAASDPELEVYSPPEEQRGEITPAGARNRRSQLKAEPGAVRRWRERMASAAGQAVYRRRKLTEHPHAWMKNRGFGRMFVHGIEKVRSVCLMQAITHNLFAAHRLRAAPA